MSEEIPEEKPALTKKQKTKADKQAEHIARIKRTLIASLIGITTGALLVLVGWNTQSCRDSGEWFFSTYADAGRYCDTEAHLYFAGYGHG